MNYAPLHNHSEYSALDGLSTVREIVERCKVIGCECCGISDHGTVAGHLEFAKVMGDAGLKPIFACELYHGVKTEFKGQERDQAHLMAGAMTDEGLRNLWRMVDDASLNFRFVGRVNWDILKKHSEGVFITSACISGLIQQGFLNDQDPYDPLNRYLDIFGDRFFIELHTYPGEEHEKLNRFLVQTAQERGVGLVYATDAHFAGPEQYDTHNAYMRLKNIEHPLSLYMQDEQQIRTSLSYLPEWAVNEALENSYAIANKCNARLPEVRRHLPVFLPSRCPWLDDDQRTAGEVFLDLVEEGLVRRYGEDAPPEVWERAATELEVYLRADLEHYFLQTWDFVQFCEREKIARGPGRGSAAGSIVAYALDITDVDPLYYGLYFERFYNEGRAEGGFPDIDNDFPVGQRKRLRDYMAGRWGKDNVRAIGTITRMKPLAAVEKTYKAYDVDYKHMVALKKIVEHTPDIDIVTSSDIGWRRELDPGKTIYVEEHVGDKIADWVESQDMATQDQLLDWIELIAIICGRVSGYGVHASGVVVSDVALPDIAPSMWSASQKVQATCFPMKQIDKLLLMKQDFLGLRNLDTLDEWEKIDGPVEWSGLERREHPEDMWQLLERGFTLGIFQIEGGHAPRKLCREIKPRCVEDLAAIVALNRPGPLRSGGADHFCRRRAGLEPVEYPHPILEDVLDETYGIFLYQEQVMKFFEKMGLDKVEADDVRAILGKKDTVAMEHLMKGTGPWEGKGFYQLAQQSGVGLQEADAIAAELREFSKYSFNKSHALCYGVMALRTLYALWKNPRAFHLALLKTNPDEAGLYVGQSRRMGIDVKPPRIDISQIESEIIDGDIIFGFSNIKGVGKGTAKYLCWLRDHWKVERGPEEIVEALEEESLSWEAERDVAKENGVPFKKKSPKQQLKSNQIPLLEFAGCWDDIYDRRISLTKRQELEKELLQVILTDNSEEVFSLHSETLDTCDSYDDFYEEETGNFHVPGVITKIEPKKTKKDQKDMGIVTIEYYGASAEFAVFPQQWRTYKFMMKDRTTGLFTLRKTDRGVHLEQATKLTV